MAKTKRDQIKRTIAQAWINIDWSGQYLDEVEKIFREQHPELADILMASMEGLVIVQETLKTWSEKVWAVENPDWISWAATGRPRKELLKADDATELAAENTETLVE